MRKIDADLRSTFAWSLNLRYRSDERHSPVPHFTYLSKRAHPCSPPKGPTSSNVDQLESPRILSLSRAAGFSTSSVLPLLSLSWILVSSLRILFKPIPPGSVD